MSSRITVACVLRSGGIYDADWVRKLRDGVARHLALPHRFVCLSDMVRDVQSADVEVIHLTEGWPGWWSKIALFRPGLFRSPVLYFDLDTVIVGSLDAIASYQHRFTMAHEFYRPHLLCSTAMAWHGDYSHIYRTFARDTRGLMLYYDSMLPETGRIGDQAFIEDHLSDQQVDIFRDLFGERSVASYKVHQCQDAPPADAVAVAFHGFPKPHQLTDGWVSKIWI